MTIQEYNADPERLRAFCDLLVLPDPPEMPARRLRSPTCSVTYVIGGVGQKVRLSNVVRVAWDEGTLILWFTHGGLLMFAGVQSFSVTT